MNNEGITVALITLSDRASQGVYEDRTGPAIEDLLRENIACASVHRQIIPDEQKLLEETLIELADVQKLDLIITNGSTGVSPRDIAPEAILAVITRRLPGYEEAMRAESLKKTIHAIISRAVCGIRGETLIISLPGSVKAAKENFLAIVGAVGHTVEKIHGDASSCGS
jgi:molybdenum cofactor synthesis domain-containing protein